MDSLYAKELTKQAIARAGVALGIKYCDKTAMDALADVLRQYIASVAVSARNQAEASGRPVPGIHDVLKALEHMRPQNITWKDLKAFALEDDEDTDKTDKWNQPFLFDVPPFPAEIANTEITEGLLGDMSTTKDAFVPAHLPAYPPTYTYRRVGKKRGAAQESGKEQDKDKRTAITKSARHSLAKLEDSVDNVE